MSPFRIRGHVEVAAIREALSHHPVVELAARKSGVPREQVHEIVTESVLDVMDVLGTRYVGEMSEVVARMTRVREAIHVVYERVLTGSGETVDVGSLRQRFEELHAATQELADPRAWAEKHAASVPSSGPSSGHTAEGVDTPSKKGFTQMPFPETTNPPVVQGKGSGRSEGEVLTSYAEALREPAFKNPATAAAGGEGGPWIRDNLYTGKEQTKVVGQLQEHGILEVSPDAGTVRVLDANRYVRWVERAYRQHGGAHLDPRMREAIRTYVDTGGPITVRGTDPHTGGGSVGGDLPGTHAELLAINDLLVSTGGAPASGPAGGAPASGPAGGAPASGPAGGAPASGPAGGQRARPARRAPASPTTVATVRAKTGAHFAACAHCSGIIDRLPKNVQVFIHTGRVTP